MDIRDIGPGVAGAIGLSLFGINPLVLLGLGITGYAITQTIIQLRGQDIVAEMTKIFEHRGVRVTGEDGVKRYPKLIKKERKDYGYQLVYKLPLGVSDEDLWKIWRGIELGTNSELEMYSDNGLVYFQLYTHELPRTVEYNEGKAEGIIPITFGYSRAGIESFDLAKAPHLLIGGETGGGKTNLMRVIIANIIKDTDVYVIDITRKLGYMKNHGWFAGDYDEAFEILQYLVQEMKRRYEEFGKMGVDEIEYIKGYPRKVLLIDEFNALSPFLVKGDTDEKLKRGIIVDGISELITRGRGCGIHLVIGLQRPDAKVMTDGQIKNSTPVRISFRTFDASNSRIVLDNGMAALIPADIPGRCVIRGKDRLRQVQVFNLDYFRAKELLPKKTKVLKRAYIPPNPLEFLLDKN